MSKEERLKRFFTHAKNPDEWEEEYAKSIAFVEREGGITIGEEYPHLKFINQLKHFGDFRNEEFKILGKMIGGTK